jgi:hypothetical protein
MIDKSPEKGSFINDVIHYDRQTASLNHTSESINNRKESQKFANADIKLAFEIVSEKKIDLDPNREYLLENYSKEFPSNTVRILKNEIDNKKLYLFCESLNDHRSVGYVSFLKMAGILVKPETSPQLIINQEILDKYSPPKPPQQ